MRIYHDKGAIAPVPARLAWYMLAGCRDEYRFTALKVVAFCGDLKCGNVCRVAADFFLFQLDYQAFVCRLKPCTWGRCGLKGLSSGCFFNFALRSGPAGSSSFFNVVDKVCTSGQTKNRVNRLLLIVLVEKSKTIVFYHLLYVMPLNLNVHSTYIHLLECAIYMTPEIIC